MFKLFKKNEIINHPGLYPSLYEDMRKQPHLLIAGATGSGKSVALNGLIFCLLHYAPKQIGLILIDPKRVELAQYRKCPHTLAYASEPRGMIEALYTAMDICDSRYKNMQKRGLRTWDGGHIYVIIDEFADLMTTNKKAVAPIIQRLAQVGRASGVHVVLCTQTPIAKVLPTEIKCNFDSRLGLRTRSSQDSRNILERSGLETLPRYGQGVYRTPEHDTLYNIPLISESEIQNVIDFWR